MTQSRQFVSAIAVRGGIVAGGVLGGFVGHWIGTLSTPAGAAILTPPVVVGAGGGLVAAWVALAWLARRHKGAGVIAGGVLIIAAVVALLAWFAWRRGG